MGHYMWTYNTITKIAQYFLATYFQDFVTLLKLGTDYSFAMSTLPL